MSNANQRKVVSDDFSVLVGGRPLYEDSDGPVYGEYDAETDMMRYGTVCNGGLVPCGEVKYDHGSSVHKNIENLIDEAMRWSRRNGKAVKQ